MVRRLPTAKVLGYSMVGWTAVSFGISFCLNVPGVWVLRLLLGVFESSFSPCLVSITISWFTKEENVWLITIWQMMFAVANFMAAGLAWQWMTLCISILSLISTVIIVVLLPDSPTRTRWATTEEKAKFVERVRSNDQGFKQKHFRKDQAWELVKDPVPWLLFGMVLAQDLVNGGLSTFNNLLINQAFGFSVSTAQLLGMPLAAFQVLLYLLIGFLATKTKNTIHCMCGYIAVNTIGTIVLLTVAPSETTRAGLLITFYFMQCNQSLSPCMWSLLARNVAGQTKKSLAYTIFFIGWAGGNAIGANFFVAAWEPRYLKSLYIHLGIYALFAIDLLTMRYIMASRNKERDLQANGDHTHSQAFDDLTDLQNQEFRYSL